MVTTTSNANSSNVATISNLEVVTRLQEVRLVLEVVTLGDCLLETIQDHRQHPEPRLNLDIVPIRLDPGVMVGQVGAIMAVTRGAAVGVRVTVLTTAEVVAVVVVAGVTAAALHLHQGAMVQRQRHLHEAMQDQIRVEDRRMAVVELIKGHIHQHLRQTIHHHLSIQEEDLGLTVAQQVLDQDPMVVAARVVATGVELFIVSHFGTLLGCLWPQARCASAYDVSGLSSVACYVCDCVWLCHL